MSKRLRPAALHVDVVKNEWLAGYQHMVARIFLDDEDRLSVEADDSSWEATALRPVRGLDPGDDPRAFFYGLAEHLHGTYLFATEPHDDEHCPYRHVVAPIRAVEGSHEAQPVH